MKPLLTLITMFAIFFGPAPAQKPQANDVNIEESVKFMPLDIFIDSGNNELAAYQFELKTVAGKVKIVGVEGGDSDAFKEPGYYDPAALANNRIIIAAFNTGDDLPSSKTRVARIHLQVIGETEPAFEISLAVAADKNENQIQAEISFLKGEQK